MNRIPFIPLVATALLAATPLLASAEELGTKLTDEQITTQVKESLKANDAAAAPAIIVSTRDGVVTLQGSAMTQGDILNALRDAESVGGVVRVENHLKLA